jgi:lipopolysaccharide transport system ATP-binding protein
MSIAIKAENISKAYQLGEFGTGTLSRDLERWYARIRGKEDPFLKIGEANNRAVKGTSDVVWSLKDINFEIEAGSAVGIIGKNGAGKSTLLKILSKVTAPSTGTVSGNGRIASLLEVGTGFHPELTGRENIFLNGAILGMRKKEIVKRFDEIVDFSGVERYIDTPVKRYSSGMYVRLAFAVAAHLESEILVVDEVLAVGDAEFQRKCIGKMEDVSQSYGRTVLFVSHNMTAVNSLCRSCIYLKEGRVKNIGNAKEVIDEYLSIESALNGSIRFSAEDAPGDEVAKLLSARLINKENEIIDSVYTEESIGVEMEYEVLNGEYLPIPNIHVSTSKGELIFVSSAQKQASLGTPGKHKAIVWIPGDLMNENKYIVGVALSTMSPEIVHFNVREALIFEVLENMNLRHNDLSGNIPGFIRPHLAWSTF